MRSVAVLTALTLAALAPAQSQAQARAQAPVSNPVVQSVQGGCFMRQDQPYNVIVKVAPVTAYYRFIFVNTANQQTTHDQVLGLIHAGQEVPIRLANAGTYQLTVKYPPSVTNQTPATAPGTIVVKPVMAATVNGQKVCRDATPVSPPSGTRPTTR